MKAFSIFSSRRRTRILFPKLLFLHAEKIRGKIISLKISNLRSRDQIAFTIYVSALRNLKGPKPFPNRDEIASTAAAARSKVCNNGSFSRIPRVTQSVTKAPKHWILYQILEALNFYKLGLRRNILKFLALGDASLKHFPAKVWNRSKIIGFLDSSNDVERQKKRCYQKLQIIPLFNRKRWLDIPSQQLQLAWRSRGFKFLLPSLKGVPSCHLK